MRECRPGVNNFTGGDREAGAGVILECFCLLVQAGLHQFWRTGRANKPDAPGTG